MPLEKGFPKSSYPVPSLERVIWVPTNKTHNNMDYTYDNLDYPYYYMDNTSDNNNMDNEINMGSKNNSNMEPKTSKIWEVCS